MLPEVCEGRLGKVHIICSACARVREAAAEIMRLWKEPEVLTAPQWQQLCTCNTLRLTIMQQESRCTLIFLAYTELGEACPCGSHKRQN